MSKMGSELNRIVNIKEIRREARKFPSAYDFRKMLKSGMNCHQIDQEVKRIRGNVNSKYDAFVGGSK